MAASKQNETVVLLETLESELDDMPRSLGIFSLCMRSLYTGEAIGTNSSAAENFRKLRDDTRNDAMVYLNDILPICEKFVTSLSEWFDYYQELDFKAWCDKLEVILEDATIHKQLCETILQMHTDLLVPLKQREDQAHLVVRELKDLKMDFEKRKEELEKSASKKYKWAVGLLFIPFVNAIASPILFAGSEADKAKAISKSAQAQIQEAAALTVEVTLIPALKSFIKSLHRTTGFFKVMEAELGNFQGKAKKGIFKRKAKSKDQGLRLHYTMMKGKARKIDAACKTFLSIIPAIQTDFEAIPIEGTDQNYVDRWLEKHIKMIEEKCTAGGQAKRLIQAITG